MHVSQRLVNAFLTIRVFLLIIQGTSYATTTAIEHMGVNHCGLDVLMTEQLLNCANVIAILQIRYL